LRSTLPIERADSEKGTPSIGDVTDVATQATQNPGVCRNLTH